MEKKEALTAGWAQSAPVVPENKVYKYGVCVWLEADVRIVVSHAASEGAAAKKECCGWSSALHSTAFT